MNLRAIIKLPYSTWLIIVLFSIIYSCSLTFHYVEGDDAATIIYHALGRNTELQKPYEAYHSGLDFILSALPANESVLRITGISLSALAELLMVILMVSLALKWLRIEARSNLALFSAIVILAAIPELFFAGLYINPTAIAMSLIMVSHFLVRRYFNGDGTCWLLPAAALFFGLGATVRWNTVLYGLIIVADIIWLSGEFNLKRIRVMVLWGLFALFCFFAFLFVQGYSPASIAEVYNFKNHIIDVNSKMSPLLAYIQTSTFYTPAMLLLSAAGLIYLFIFEKKLFLFSLLSIGLMWLLFQSFFFKMMITIFPVFFMIIIAGIRGLEKLIKSVTVSGVLIIFACAGIWLTGLKINNSKIWGPGFELKEKYYSYRDKSAPVLKEKYNYSLAFMDGCGYPSPEGPRPMGGYAGILMGGKWRAFMREDKKEYNAMIDSSLKNGYPLIKVEYNYYVENLLAGRGFTSSGSYKNEIIPGLCKRSFYNMNDTIDIYHILKQIDVKDSLVINSIMDDSNKSTFIIYGGHYGKQVDIAVF